MSLDLRLHPHASAGAERARRVLPFATGFLPVARCSGVLATIAAALMVFSCGDSAEDLFAEGRAAGEARFGELGRVRASVDAGRIVAIDDSEAPLELRVRAASPLASIELSNGMDRSVRVSLIVENIATTARVLPVLRPLDARARRAPGCATGSGPSTEVSLAPLGLEARGDTTGAIEVELPRCAAITFSPALPPDTTEYVIAVVAPIDARASLASRAFAVATGEGAHHVHFLGDLGDPRRALPFAAVAEAAADSGVTFSASMGRAELRDGGGAFIEAFGPADFVAHVAGVRVVVLNSASGRLTDAQFSLLEALPAGAPGVLATYRAPVPVGVTPALRSEAQGARLINSLRARDFSHAFVGGGVRAGVHELGGIEVHDLSGAAGGSEPTMALVTVRVGRGLEPPEIDVRSVRF